MIRLSFAVLCFFLLLTDLSGAPVRGRWKCTSLGPSTLALTGDYTDVQNQLFHKRFAERIKWSSSILSRWAVEQRFNLSGTEAIAQYRPEITALLLNQPQIKLVSQSSVPVSAIGTGYWLNPVGQSRFPDEKAG